jgi:arylsulfatase A-like enzyme
VTEAIEWVDRSKDPWFLYVHLMDVHMPYKRPAIDGRPWRSRRLMDPRPGGSFTKEEREDIIAHYDGGLRSADHAVGRLLTAVEKRGRPYFAVITADHGESLGEHGRWGHGRGLDPEALRVPLLVMGEGAVPGRSPEPVGHSAIGPTLLAAAGVPCHECGPTLRPSAGGSVVRGALPPHERYVIFAGHKLLVDKRLRQSRLYDLQKDPLETKDLAPEMPELAELLRQQLGGESPVAAPSAGDIERMRALGYLGSDAPALRPQ